MNIDKIKPVNEGLRPALVDKINNKTKPLGALGVLETLAVQLGLIQQSLDPVLSAPKLLVFAGDHGISSEGVSAYPQEVTYQMVLNFLQGGAAINVFCAQHGIELSVIDAGVNGQFLENSGVINKKIGLGTQNFAQTEAMTLEQCNCALLAGRDLVLAEKSTNIFGFGEMGIGNTSSASVLMSLFCDLPVEQCVGKGTGLDSKMLENKISVLQAAIDKHQDIDRSNVMQVLSTFGGFEIIMMAGAMLAAAEQGKAIIIDGFIATAAFLSAYKIDPNILGYAIFSHQSDEQGHGKMLDFLGVRPLLKLDLRLGEGTGCALVFPLIQSAINFLNEMASFESAGVSNK